MTVEDDNTIYVGNLPYDCTESLLRRVFDLYGSIVNLKIINDRSTGGRCYGFVSFKNPRSAMEAISEMNGRTIGGRVVRVNEATTRGAGGRSNYGKESLRRTHRDMDWEDRGRGMENAYHKDRQRDTSREYNGERERRRDYSRDRDNSRDNFLGRNRSQSWEMGVWQQEQGRVRKRSHDWEWERNDDLNANAIVEKEFDSVDHHDRRVDKNKEQYSKRRNSSSSCGQQSREFSSESSDYQYQVEEKLHSLFRRRDELQKEISEMEKRVVEKKKLAADLEKKSLKLEDSLASAKKQSSERQLQLTKLYTCFQQVKEYGDKLRSSEEELQDLVTSVSREVEAGEDLGTKEVYLTNGKL